MSILDRSRTTTPLPAPGRWQIDPGHAEVAFIGRHMMLTKVRGRFTGVEGAITVADDAGSGQPDPAGSSVEVHIDMTTVESGSDVRDDHLRSADLFDVEHFPTATYRSTSVRWDGTTGVVDGLLTIKGITRAVALDVELVGVAEGPDHIERAVFSASTTIRRADFDVSWNMALEGGGLLVSKEVRIEIELEAVRAA